MKKILQLNFDHNNLMLEREVNDKDFDKDYVAIKECANIILNENSHIKNRFELFEIAKIASTKALILDNNKIFYGNTFANKLLLITNVIFPDEDNFIDVVLNEFSVDIDKVFELKDVLNTLNKNDWDYLNSTIGALIDKYIPNYILIAERFGMKDNPDFILVKLLEIIYLHPEKFNLDIKKQK